jgi:pyruvate-formate lyase
MEKRQINPYRISRKNRQLLRRKLLPYWQGKAIADILKKELERSDIYTGDLSNFSAALPASTAHNDTIISTGAAFGTWQGHLILDHETPIRKGLIAMREDVQELLAGSPNDEERDFLRSIDIALEGVMIFSRRLAEKLGEEAEKEQDSERKKRLARMHAICMRVPLYPAESFYEAVQSYWTVKTAVELAIPFNAHSPGRLDQFFCPYYERDISEGSITPEEASELLEELFLKVMSQNMRPYSNFTSYFTQRYEGSEPVTMGGLTGEEKDATNDLTYLMLEAAGRSRAALNFVVRLHRSSPQELFMKVAELHHAGVSSVSMMNDEVSIEALENRGFSHEDAVGYAITGCVDMVAPGKTGGEAFSAVLLCRILDMALRNGDSKTLIGTLEGVSIKTGDPDTFTTYSEFEDAFARQVAFQIEKIVKATRIRDTLYDKYLPAPFISAFMQGCLEKRRDVTKGGAVYDLEGILIMNSIANVVDSLYVIKKLIFEQKRFTFSDLIDGIDNNYDGYDWMYNMIQDLEGKWGNGNPESDEIARRVTTRIFEETYKYRTYKGGYFAPFINSMTAHTYDGRISIATPDGRKAAKPYAASCNPYNVDQHGPTGVLRSVAAIDFSHVLGCAVNIRMHPTAIGTTEEARLKWISLVKTYFQMGGEQLQPTVVSTELLRAAQQDPENYRNVIVKVGGYSAYFVDLGCEIQNEIIERTEHSML